jgi:hypothetical protein
VDLAWLNRREVLDYANLSRLAAIGSQNLAIISLPFQLLLNMSRLSALGAMMLASKSSDVDVVVTVWKNGTISAKPL